MRALLSGIRPTCGDTPDFATQRLRNVALLPLGISCVDVERRRRVSLGIEASLTVSEKARQQTVIEWADMAMDRESRLLNRVGLRIALSIDVWTSDVAFFRLPKGEGRGCQVSSPGDGLSHET